MNGGNILMNKISMHLHRDNLASKLLDSFRGIAAFLVLIQHVRAHFFQNYQDQINTNVIQKAFYMISALGHQSVMIFFVLSGYFISSSVLKSIHSNSWSWRDYFINRVSRLMIVLIPSLILCAIWDLLGTHVLSATPLYSGEMKETILNFSAIDRLSITNFLGNLFFLQGILTPTFGTNGALWSLSYEFWYYMIFPCLVLAIVKRKWKYAFISFLMFFFVGKQITLYFFIWSIGYLINVIPPLKIKSQLFRAVYISLASFIFVVSVALSALHKLPLSDLIIALSFAFIIYLVISFYNHTPMKNTVINKIPNFFADFSYSLYLVHVPFITFIYALLLKLGFHKWEPSLKNILLGSLIVILAMIYAWFISIFTEAKTTNVKRVLNKKTYSTKRKVA